MSSVIAAVVYVLFFCGCLGIVALNLRELFVAYYSSVDPTISSGQKYQLIFEVVLLLFTATAIGILRLKG